MRIVHLSTHDTQGGAARAAYRIHRSLIDRGIDSTLMVKYKWSTDPTVVPSAEPANVSRIRNFLRSAGNISWPILYPHTDRRKKFSPLLFYRSAIPVEILNKFDIVCLYYVCDGLLAPENLANIRTPVVWRLSDMWSFTGGCHYSGDCLRYREGCGLCPILGSRAMSDLSRRLVLRKKNAWRNVPITVVAPSRWIKLAAEESFLFRGREVQLIPTGIDTNVFQPRSRKAARIRLGIPPEAKVILYGTANALSDPRKGYSTLLKALRTLPSLSNTIFLVFGDSTNGTPSLPGVEFRCSGIIRDDSVLVDHYSAADVFVSPSLEENLPNTALEAMACGAPTVAFRIGGLPDLIVHSANGYLASPGDAFDLARGISWVLKDACHQKLLSAKAHSTVLRGFSQEATLNAYLMLYKQVIAKGKRAPEPEMAYG